MYRTLHRITLCVLPILACVYTSKAQCPASTPLVIHSITTTESRCQASGTATVSVSGGSTPYTFSIIAGPTLSPPQSTNILQSLAPGTYTIQVTDNCNTSDTTHFTITGSYVVPALSITTQSPGCPGSSDGSITINVTNGRAPLSYSLISPSPVTAAPQTSNVFTGLPVGTYTCQVTDSCGNIQTRMVSLSAPSSAVTIVGGNIQYLGCDSFAVIMVSTISNYKPPYTTTWKLLDGSVVTHVLTAPAINYGNEIFDTLYLRYHHIQGATDDITVTVTNQCGISASNFLDISAGMDMQARGILSPGCNGQYYYIVDGFPQLHCATVTYTLISPSGAVLATQTNNSEFSGYPPGTGYKVIRQDCCKTDTLQFDWASRPAFKIAYTQNLSYGTCKEGTTSLFITFSSDPVDIVLASGPPSVTFADGTVHTYTYPDTTHNVRSGALLGYFGAGTYKIYAISQCGEKDSVTVTFGSSDVLHSVFTPTLEKGCTDASKILLNVTSNTGWASGLITVNSIYNHFVYLPDNTFNDSIQNLTAGTYYTTYQYQNAYGITYVGMADPGCDVINDTIVVPVYKQPLFSSSAAVALCGATRQVALLPDSTSGAAPYQYRIIAGSTTTSLQASPVFAGLSTGTYTFQMVDACANSYTRDITIDTLTLPNIVTTGNTCIGGAATFTLPASPFYSYSWLRPNGSTSTGNTLSINPVTNADTGTYKVAVTSTIGGCTNTASKSYILRACSVLAENLLRFSGQRKNNNIQLNWQTADEVNMSYYIVERSTDGYVFTPVQRVEATGGMQNTYTATDTHVPSGTVYYRLESVEKGGAINYSSIITFNNLNAQPFTVYPSLVTGNTPVTVTGPVASQTAFIRVIGADGKVWQTIAVAAGATKTRIDVTSMPKGSYFIVFTDNDHVITTKIWKE